MRPIHYYVEETDQMNAFMNLVGEYFEKLTPLQFWQLNMVICYDLQSRKTFILQELVFVRKHVFKITRDDLLDSVLTALEGISRKTAKQLILAIAAIAAESDQY